MLGRYLEKTFFDALQHMPIVALLGPRQVGKTTLALTITEADLGKKVAYLDLELDSDLSKLDDPESYLKQYKNQLLIIDEVQRKPDLFRILRALVDQQKRQGETAGQFLLLSSASRELLQHSAETLAGRIRYLELSPFSAWEVYQTDPLRYTSTPLWFRGGFPDSYLAPTDNESWEWRNDFISTYVERDIPLMGPQIPATKMKRAIEIKRSSAPVAGKGFHTASEDIKATRKFVVYGGTERFPMGGDTEAIGLIDFLKLLETSGNPS